MHELDLILTLAGGLTAALIFGYLTHRVGLSPIVGYLLAGTLVGPHTPGFVANAGIAEQLADLGVILLMFGVGLKFHVEELVAVRRVAIPGALIASGLAAALGFAIAHGTGWTPSASLIFGMALSVASTVVLVRVLTDNRALHTHAGHIAVGWLVVEDLLIVVALVLLPVFVGPATSAMVCCRERCSSPPQGGSAGALHGRGRKPSHSGVARPGGGDSIAGALHADRARRWRWGLRSGPPLSSGCRWRLAPSSQAWSSGVRTTVTAPHRRRCRCVTPLR